MKKTQEQKDLEAAIQQSLGLNKQDVEQRYGVAVRNVRGDGNCFYHAIADQLKLNSLTSDLGDLNDRHLRGIAIEHLKNNRDMYQDAGQATQMAAASGFRPKTVGGPAKDYDDYVKIHSRVGEYADQGIVGALSRALKVNIVVLQPGADPVIQKQDHDRPTLYVYYQDRHYQSAIPDLANPRFANLAERILRHEVDELTDFKTDVKIQLHPKISALSGQTSSMAAAEQGRQMAGSAGMARSELELLGEIHESIEKAMIIADPVERKRGVVNALRQIKIGEIQPKAFDALYANFEKQNQINPEFAITKLVQKVQEKAAGLQNDAFVRPSPSPRSVFGKKSSLEKNSAGRGL